MAAKAGPYYLVGVGVNLKEAPSVPPEIRAVYGAVGAEEKDPEALVLRILEEGKRLAALPRSAIVSAYRGALILTGKEIVFTENGKEFSGLCLGADDDLHLLVRIGASVRTLSSGEVSVSAPKARSEINS